MYLCDDLGIPVYHIRVDWADKESWPEERVGHIVIKIAFYVAECSTIVCRPEKGGRREEEGIEGREEGGREERKKGGRREERGKGEGKWRKRGRRGRENK